MTHWYIAPSTCSECGKELADPVHHRRCSSVWSFGPGFAHCESPRDHDGPHRLRNWDGVLYVGPDSEGEFEKVHDETTERWNDRWLTPGGEEAG